MPSFLHWLLAILSVLIAAYLLPGVTVSGLFAAFVTALVLGLVNAFIRPMLLVLTFPFTVATLGLFALVVNALLILLVSAIVPGFHVASMWSAILFSIVLSIVAWALDHFVP